MDRRSWWATPGPWGCIESYRTKQLNNNILNIFKEKGKRQYFSTEIIIWIDGDIFFKSKLEILFFYR